MRTFRGLISGLLLLFFCGCAASIDLDRVKVPQFACPGDVVTLEWSAKGHVTLAVDGKDQGKVSSCGHQPMAIHALPGSKQSVFLKATGLLGLIKDTFTGGTEVLDSPADVPYGERVAPCKDGRLETTFNIVMSPHIRLSQLANVNPQPIEISKDGAAFHRVGAEASTNDFDHQPMNGTWTLRATLDSGDTCDAPHSLLILAGLVCE